jgi:hypothetical protein
VGVEDFFWIAGLTDSEHLYSLLVV